MDMVWRGTEKDPLLIEINPFDGEALCVFKGSTGLFDWSDLETDRKIIMGESDQGFVIRVNESETKAATSPNRNPDWIKVVKMMR